MTQRIRIEVPGVNRRTFIRSPNHQPPPSGVTVSGPIVSGAKALGSEEGSMVVEFVINTVAVGITINLISSYIYNYFSKHDPKKISIDQTVVKYDKGEIEQVIRTKIAIRE